MAWKSWIIALLGLWEFGDIAAPFVIGFGHVMPAVWNHIFVGLILIVAGSWAAITRNRSTARTLSWIAAGAGAWLVIASFLLRDLTNIAGLLNDVLVGATALILGVWAALAAPRTAD